MDLAPREEGRARKVLARAGGVTVSTGAGGRAAR